MRTPTLSPFGERHFKIIDLLRGIGFLLVVLRHSLDFLNDGSLGMIMPQDQTILDFFFITGGFVAGYALESKLQSGQLTVGRALLRRAIRLYPLVILATLLGAVPLFVRLAYWGADQRILPDLIVLIKGCLLIPTHSAVEMPGYYDYVFPYDLPMWYLLFDALGFLFFLFVLRFLSLGKLLAVGALMAFGMWAGAIINNGLVFGAVWTTLLPTLPRALFGVTAGYVLFRLYRPNQFMLGPKFALLPVILLLATVFIPVPSSWPYSGELQAFGATFIMPAIIVLSLHINAGPRAAMAARIGSRLSLPVYVLHIPVIVFLNESAVHLLGLGHFPRIPLVALEAASALAFSCLASWYYDEPVRSWLTAKARSWTMGAPALKPGDA